MFLFYLLNSLPCLKHRHEGNSRRWATPSMLSDKSSYFVSLAVGWSLSFTQTAGGAIYWQCKAIMSSLHFLYIQTISIPEPRALSIYISWSLNRWKFESSCFKCFVNHHFSQNISVFNIKTHFSITKGCKIWHLCQHKKNTDSC